MILERLNIPLFDQEAWLIVTKTTKEAVEIINTKFTHEEKIEYDGENVRGFQWNSFYIAPDNHQYERFFIYINVSEIKTTTLEHELIHLSWAILAHAGIKLSLNNHEALAYLYENLLKQCKEIIYGRFNNTRTKKLKTNSNS